MPKGVIRAVLLICHICILFLVGLASPLHAVELSRKEMDFLRGKDTIVFVSQTRYPPFEFTDEEGQHEGMMRDVVRWLAMELGFKPVFTNATFQEAQDDVLQGEADVLTSLFYSDKRNERFEFTSTLFEVPASIFVQAGRTDIKDLKDLNGKIVAIQRGDYAKEFLESRGVRVETLDTSDFGEAADMVATGRADAVIGDEQIVLYHIFSNRLTDRIKKVGDPLYTGKNCMASSKNNAILIGILNKGIEEARVSGVLEKISKKWLGTMYGPHASWLDRYLWPVSAAAAGFVLLSLWVWVWNIRLRTMVRKKTEHIRRSEAALRESEAKYRELFENASDIIYTQDLTGKYTSINETGRRTFGYTSEEFVNLTYKDVVDPQYLSLVEDYFLQKAKYGFERTGPYELVVRAKDGTPVWVEINSRIIGDRQAPLGLHGTARDITDRKRAEEALRESQEKYRLVVDNANEAILVAQDNQLKFVNPRVMELTGYSEEEMKSAPFVSFIHPDDRSLVAERHEKRLAGGRIPSLYPFRIVDKRGNVKWVEINAISISWEGRPATLNFLVDITSKRRTEEELTRIQKLESVGILAGGIAHDFNNILTAILGNISLARMPGKLSEDTARRLTDAEKACLQAQALTQQLLTFSKGGAPIRKASEIAHLIKDSCHLAVRGAKVRCEFSIPDDLPTVEIDEGQIGQVLNNLVINAVHAMPQGGVIGVEASMVSVDSERGLPLKNGDYVRIVVQDHGVGIPQDVLPRIFDPYFTTKHNGSGLGLATSYSIVKNHEGIITVESEPGKGTVFHVYLPASREAVQRSVSSEEPAVQGAGKVLLMDDEDSIRVVLSEMLSIFGYAVEVAKDGAEAIELYQTARAANSPFDVVILDLTVPAGMGGAEALRRLREIDPGIKAIVSSGYSNDPIMADYKQYGFHGVVAKPYTPKDLSETLMQVITGCKNAVQTS